MRRSIILTGMLWFTIAAASAAGETTGPVALYTPPLYSPEEVAGTGLAPQAAVEVDVDPSGVVSAVRVLSIEPSTEFDDAYVAKTTETLLRWRYAPATSDGEPVGTTLSWNVKFRPLAAREDEPEVGSVVRLDSLAGGSRARRWADLLGLREELRVELLQRLVDTATEFMDADALKRVDTPRFVVLTDAPSDEAARILAQNLEATFGTLFGLLGDDLAPQPATRRLAVFVYSERRAYTSMQKRIEGFEWSAGFYNPLGLLAFHLEMPSPAQLLGTLLHEGTHAWVDLHLVKPGVVFPQWLGEGLAEYVGNSEIKRGKLVPGRTRRSDVYRAPGVMFRAKSEVQLGLEDVRIRMRKGETPDLARLVAAEPDEFYGEDRAMYYMLGWLLVHFLRHGEDDWAEERFPRLLLYAAEGYPATEAIRELYGDLSDLDAAFEKYVRRF